ncbi:bleomycin hydrolase [Neocloeon triangulifer]|uniref:bleomycin hydrolase n=1 Tax=Neocloeon triangulifer TaxID=2078957 RepID=UPI00286F744E|nr:bleomycin hydrolase [Neocloeon triangulifer]
MATELTLEELTSLKDEFFSDEKNVVAQNACTRADPQEVCVSRQRLQEVSQHVFEHKVEAEIKPMTDQKNSGRCWLFATLNVIRLPFAKAMNIEEFEFSQGHLFFWDKIERCHFFLHNIVETVKRGEAVDGRLVSFLLHDPTCDGGQWDMVANLITKHGLVPKKCFPESFSCESSIRLNSVLKSKLREFAKELRNLVEAGEDPLPTIKKQMKFVYRTVSIFLGVPPTEFTWQYLNKTKKYNSIGPITPQQFYEQHVKPIFNLDEKVCLVTDPRPSNPYGHLYTVDCLGNMVGGRTTIYNNQPVELLAKVAAESIKANEAVWFGCEVNKRFAGKAGLLDLELHNWKSLLGEEVYLNLDKAERLQYGDSMMTHAMVFTAVSTDDEGKPIKWRVENSWGDDRGEKGYLLMTQRWFDEFMYEVVVDKKFVPQEVLDIFQQKPVVLPAWDPMGTLAL